MHINIRTLHAFFRQKGGNTIPTIGIGIIVEETMERLDDLETLVELIDRTKALDQTVVHEVNNLRRGNDTLIAALATQFNDFPLLSGLRSLALEFSLRRAEPQEPLFEELLETMFRRDPGEITIPIENRPVEMGRGFAFFLSRLLTGAETQEILWAIFADLLRNYPLERRAIFDWLRILGSADLARDLCRDIIAETINQINIVFKVPASE